MTTEVNLAIASMTRRILTDVQRFEREARA